MQSKFLSLLPVLLYVTQIFAWSNVVYVIREAEKASMGAGGLTPVGRTRASCLVSVRVRLCSRVSVTDSSTSCSTLARRAVQTLEKSYPAGQTPIRERVMLHSRRLRLSRRTSDSVLTLLGMLPVLSLMCRSQLLAVAQRMKQKASRPVSLKSLSHSLQPAPKAFW